MRTILRSQLASAYRFIDSVRSAENLVDAKLKYNPNEAYSLVVRVDYRKSGQEAAPLIVTKYMSVDTKGLLRDCREIYAGNAYYGYIGSLLPLSLQSEDVKVLG